jgi:hypothetical protein
MTAALEHEAATLEVAASLLALAMLESHPPVDALGAALERMAYALSKCTKALERARSAKAAAASTDRLAADVADCHETLERELAACVEGLQFHDRLMQQLAHVRNCLAALSHAPQSGDVRAQDESWMRLRSRLWHRLSSDSQRALLDLLLPTAPGHLGAEPRRLNASEGSIELF